MRGDRMVVTVGAALGLVGACRWVREDYRRWRALGPGGLPATPIGWLTTTALRWRGRDPTSRRMPFPMNHTAGDGPTVEAEHERRTMDRRPDLAALAGRVRGEVLTNDQPGFLAAVEGLVWQERKPDRRPDVIVRVRDTADVAATVAWACDEGLTVSARSGGHSWGATSVRDGGVLVDLGALDDIELAPDLRTATVGPAVTGQQLSSTLRPHGRFFPGGHHGDVKLGGFLLGGGYGWWGQHYQQACLSVIAVRVVTATGDVIDADASHHPDFFWAARGAGPAFFGIAVSFTVALYPLPGAFVMAQWFAPRDECAAVMRWAWAVHGGLDDRVEFSIQTLTDPENTPLIMIVAVALGDDEAGARELLAPLLESPAADPRRLAVPPTPVELDDLYAGARLTNPEGMRWAVDNAWITGTVEEVLPLIEEAYATLPSPHSNLMWYHWVPKALPDDAALSVHAPVYLAAYATYASAADDHRCRRWATDLMARFQPHSVGTQISDENFVHRFDRPLSTENLVRLAELTRRHDPAGRFAGFPVDGQPR